MTDAFMGMFGGASSNIEFNTDEVFDSAEMAKEFIDAKKPNLEAQVDKSWNELSDFNQKENNKLFDDGYVYSIERYIIVPVQEVVEISAVPKHRRS